MVPSSHNQVSTTRPRLVSTPLYFMIFYVDWDILSLPLNDAVISRESPMYGNVKTNLDISEV